MSLIISDTSSSLVCIARRLPLAEKTNTMLGVEQFTTKQDLNGKIIGCDIRCVFVTLHYLVLGNIDSLVLRNIDSLVLGNIDSLVLCNIDSLVSC